ncbi:hypothetical protein [Pediococcus pentosaceus]|uniref:hypothetical protein n=1 Tax=Pediococcus pentosaceus TaxID=1255 RepID=UPI0021AFFB6F|nr:hypothetical protein [Pediococcus pentosaceus]
MSKRKNKLTAAQKSEKAQAVIADSRKPTLTIDNLPTWLQGIALSRFKWIQVDCVFTIANCLYRFTNATK